MIMMDKAAEVARNAVAYCYSATVLKVVDGDTVDFSANLGFRVRVDIRTRLYGMDAPEMNTPAGKASKLFLQSLMPVSLPVVLQTYKDPTDKYGRWLATVVTTEGNVINEIIIGAGHAVAKVY